MINIRLLCSSFLAVVFFSLGLFAENVNAQQVNGTVTAQETGESLPGVTVLVEGTNIGTNTDSEGNYQLSVPSLNETLVFSFVGYQSQSMRSSPSGENSE